MPTARDHLENRMIKFDRILVPTDFSECAEHAFRYAVDLAERCDASVTALYVETLHGEVRDHVRGQMEELLSTYRGAVHVTSHVTRGVTAAPAIIDYAKDQGIDLIVIGTHGRRGFRRMVIGSVASEVVQHTDRAVLTVRGGPEFEQFEFPPRQILAPIDFSNSSRPTLQFAKELAVFYGADLHLLHVVEDRFHPAFYGPRVMSVYDIDPDIEKKACDHLRELFEDSPGPDVRYTVEARPGHASHEIVQHAIEDKSQLIVIATHGLTGLTHFFLGSVAERVICVSPCPVFTVNARPAREKPTGA